MEIYLGFAQRVWQGASLDVALTEARRKFKREVRKRGQVRLELEHPFFWAGIVLYPRREPIGWLVVMFPLMIPLFTFVKCLVLGDRGNP